MSKEYKYWAGISFHMKESTYEVFFPEFSNPLIVQGGTKDEALSIATEKLKARLVELQAKGEDFPVHKTEFPVDLQFSSNTVPELITVTIE